MYKILVVAPYTNMVTVVHNIKDLFLPHQIMVRVGILEDVKPYLEEADAGGIDAIVARGATAQFIREHSGIPVVETAPSQLEVFKAINQVKNLGKKIGVLWHSKIPGEETLLFDEANVNIKCFDYKSKQDLEDAISKARDEGVEILLGGAYSIYLAEKYGMRGVLIEISAEAIAWSIEQALNLCEVKKQEEIGRVMAETIINSVHDAILAVDRHGKITVCNPLARKLLSIEDERTIIGKPIQDVFPRSKLLTVIANRREESGDIQDLGTVQVMSTRVPMILNDEVVGAVETFADVTEVQRNEQMIRIRGQDKGFVAKWSFTNINARSPKMQECVRNAQTYANSKGSIIIHGETGVGKEVIAQSIHNASPVRHGPFVAINCAAVPVSLLESELFGYEEGAFSGSRKGGKMGLFELAHGGSLFLDEIGEISTSIQARLLRALQEKCIMRIGGSRIIPVDVRIIAATNIELLPRVSDGSFRKDIYYRLSTFSIRIPPLRERPEDIIDLFVTMFAGSSGFSLTQSERIVEKIRHYLLSYSWPGNVRELHNVVQRFSLLTKFSNDYRANIVHAIDQPQVQADEVTVTVSRKPDTLKLMVRDVEREIIEKMLAKYNDNILEVCKVLGLSRTSFWRKYQLTKNEIFLCKNEKN